MSGQLYLVHHGIPGQKWGEQNGPPYPLNPKTDYTKAEKTKKYSPENPKSKSKKKSSSKAGNPQEKKEQTKRGLTDRQKKILKIGAASVATALAVYGGYKLSQNEDFRKLIGIGQRQLVGDTDLTGMLHQKAPSSESASAPTNSNSSFITDIGRSLAQKTGLPLMTKPMDLSHAAAEVNPHRGDPKYVGNCSNCVTALFCRMMGLDVQAAPMQNAGHGINITDLKKVFKNFDDHVLTPAIAQGSTADEYAARLERQILRQCKNANEKCWGTVSTTGHVFAWIVENGGVRIVEPQEPKAETRFPGGKGYLAYHAAKAVAMNIPMSICRVDNLEIDAKNLLDLVVRR